MTQYKVTNGWWEGIIEADSMDMAGSIVPENTDMCIVFWRATDSPEGDVLVGIATPNLIAVEEDKLSCEVVREQGDFLIAEGVHQ